MRSYDKHRNTKFIQKSDVSNSPHEAVLVTIKSISEENCAPENQPIDEKFVLNFEEDFKPWAPCFEALETIAQISGSGNVDDWPGTKIVLFVDPTVKFGRKTVGGVRCRAPRKQTDPDAPEPEQLDVKPVITEDDIPF